jgi:RND family efflux transporter MFP subunit
MQKITTFFKKPIVVIATAIILTGGMAGGYFIWGGGENSKYDIMEVKKTDLLQEVSVTGRVNPAESVDLAFETVGKVARVYVKIGDNVRIGQVLASLSNGELAAQLLQAQANLETEQVKLDETKKGARTEEILKAETTLADKEKDLLNVRAKAEADLKNVYSAALTAAQSGITEGKNALLELTEIQFAHFMNNDSSGMAIADAKEDAVEVLLGAAAGAGKMNTEQLSLLNSGAFGAVQTAISDSSLENVENAVSQTITALRKVKFALDIVPIEDDFTSTQKTDLSTARTTVSTELTTVSAKEQAIAVQKATNASNISTAESAVNTARNDLLLKQISSTPEQIAAQEARVKSARASVQNIQAQLAKTVIISPIIGTVTKQEAKAGEIVAANSVMVSVMSEAKFEIEANIPEADIAKIKLNDFAKITLDAYGEDIVFEGRVIEIEPAETIVEGVSTYKITLQFVNEDDRIRSGMTANIDILTAMKDGILAVPQRAIISKNGKGKFVKIIKDDGTTEEVQVETGIRGSSGEIEIISGLKEGDMVITFERE